MNDLTIIIAFHSLYNHSYFAVHGDYRYLNESSRFDNDQRSREVRKLIFTDEGEFKQTILEEFPTDAVSNGAHVIAVRI